MAHLRMLLLVGLCFTPAAVRAQATHGVVLEESTRAPIAGVLVELVESGGAVLARTQTNGAGAFFFLQRRADAFSLRLTHLAYATVMTDTLLAGRAETLALELRMARAAIPLEPLVVTGRANARLAGFQERMRKRSFGQFLTRSDIARRPGARATDLLREVPGVELLPIRAGLGAGTTSGNLIAMRGRRCMPTVYIDGMEVKQFAESPLDDFLSPGVLEGVEIYTTAASAPAPIVARDACGVVAFWTRADALGKWSWKKFAAGAGAFALLTTLTLLIR